MSESVDRDYLDDPNFVLRFVNKKSTERVMELVTKIKEAFKQPEDTKITEPARALALTDAHPELLLASPHILDLAPDDGAAPPPAPRLASLKPFLFPFYPASAPRQRSDPEYEKVRQGFLTAARTEHERLLWGFQDRFIRDLCAADEQFQRSPFQVATAQIAREQTLPIHLVEKRKETLQTRVNSLMRKSQRKAAAVLEAQKEIQAKRLKLEQDVHDNARSILLLQKRIEEQREINTNAATLARTETGSTEDDFAVLVATLHHQIDETRKQLYRADHRFEEEMLEAKQTSEMLLGEIRSIKAREPELDRNVAVQKVEMEKLQKRLEQAERISQKLKARVRKLTDKRKEMRDEMTVCDQNDWKTKIESLHDA